MRTQLFVACLLAGCSVNVPTFSSEIDAGDNDDIDASTIDASTIDAPPPDAACGDVCDSYCLRGSITVTNAFDVVNGNPSTMFFEHLEQTPSDYNLVFDVDSSFQAVGDGSSRPEGQLRVLSVTIKRFTFADTQMNDRYGATYAGMAYPEITLVNGPTRGIYMGNMTSPHIATTQEWWGWEAYTTPAPIQLAADGYPELLRTTGEGTGNLTLRRYSLSSMTDYAETTWTVQLLHGIDCQ